MRLTVDANGITCSEHDNERARRLFAGMHAGRCIDLTDHGCDWRTLPAAGCQVPMADVWALAADHVLRERHVVAVIDDGVVTTLIPPPRQLGTA
jgi:hypothetical protein